jgi:hypothetical protein
MSLSNWSYYVPAPFMIHVDIPVEVEYVLATSVSFRRKRSVALRLQNGLCLLPAECESEFRIEKGVLL